MRGAHALSKRTANLTEADACFEPLGLHSFGNDATGGIFSSSNNKIAVAGPRATPLQHRNGQGAGPKADVIINSKGDAVLDLPISAVQLNGRSGGPFCLRPLP